MLRKLAERKDEEGFTLIELLVVVIIIGILAAIAIPVFLNQRENAWRGAAESDARNAAIEVESYFTQLDEYPADNDAFQAIEPMTESPGVTLAYELVDTNTYTLTATHENIDGGLETVAFYDSAEGGIVQLDESGAPVVEDEEGGV